MTSADTSLANALLDHHPCFLQARSRIIPLVENRKTLTIDELVVLSRTPVRTALLVTDHLHRKGLVQFGQGIRPAGETGQPGDKVARTLESGRPELDATILSLRPRYLKQVQARESPCLVWGQRRLLPWSSLERAHHVLEVARRLAVSGTVIFLGDDDLVSPVVAATTGWRVIVVDIDGEVLKRASHIANCLGAHIEPVHADLSETPAGLDPSDIVVCDPYPSGDGSFEAIFWQQALTSLRVGGLLITTVAPSHKPEGYARGALAQLDNLGLQLIDLKADFGCYEIFDFELVKFERDTCADIGCSSTVSHTKSLLTARMVEEYPAPKYETVDFRRWTSATLSHYLTRQAGATAQLAIASTRCPSSYKDMDSTHRNPSEAFVNQASDLPNRIGAYLPQKNARELASIIQTIDESSRLGLALRAIESWERWRLDG